MRALPAGLIVVIALAACPVRALAQQQDNSAAVEALFDEGKRLMIEGRVAQACPKFLASYDLEHRLGTLLNLAACYEKNEQLASAWARFVEARTLAARAGQPERQQFADEHARALEPKLSKLTVAVTKPLPGMAVKVDGSAIAQGAWGVAVPMDAGKHVIEATAPDHTTYRGEVTVGANADQQSVTVPELAEAPSAPASGEAAGAPVEASRGLGGGRIAALAIAGVGVVSLGVGGYFGAAALGKKGDPSYGAGCDGSGNCQTGSQGLQLHRDAFTDATMSTIFLGAGAACVVGGAVLWLVSPSGSAPSTSVGFDGRTIRVAGTF